jgi:hypothetical protein
MSQWPLRWFSLVGFSCNAVKICIYTCLPRIQADYHLLNLHPPFFVCPLFFSFQMKVFLWVKTRKSFSVICNWLRIDYGDLSIGMTEGCCCQPLLSCYEGSVKSWKLVMLNQYEEYALILTLCDDHSPYHMANFYFHSKWWPHYLVLCAFFWMSKVLSTTFHYDFIVLLSKENCKGNLSKLRKTGRGPQLNCAIPTVLHITKQF